MKLLVADIGGTNMRAAIGESGTKILENSSKKKTGSVKVTDFLKQFKEFDYEQIMIAAAGPKTGDSLHLTNADVKLSKAELEKQLKAPVTIINDVAAACASLKILDQIAHEVINKQINIKEKVALISIGTGLGVAIYDVEIIATEKGHSKDQQTGKEYEDILSGSAIKKSGLATSKYLQENKEEYLKELNEFLDMIKKQFGTRQFALTGGVVKYNKDFFKEYLKREENTILITQAHIGLIGAAQWN